MTRKKIEVSAGTPRWKCLESRTDSKRLHYGRFSLSPLMKGQADTIGIVMRRTLLGEVEGTCITRAKFENVRHEYTTIFGVEESVHEVLMNLKEIVLRSDLYGIRAASISARGPGYVTAQDIFLPRYVEIVDTAQHIASLTKPIDLRIKLQIERSRGYRMRTPKDYQDQSYPIDAVSMPVRNVNYSIHSRGNEKQEMLFLEIWTNGSLTPREALYEASHNLMHFFIPFLDLDTEEQNLYLDIEDNQNGFPGRFTFTTPALFTFIDNLHKKKKKKRETSAKYIFIDQLGLRYSIYTRLKGAKIHRLSDLLSLTHKDLVRMRIQLHAEDIKKICDFLERHSLTLIPESKD